VQEITDDITEILTIPVFVKFEGTHRIYNFSEIEKKLKEAEKIVIQDCGCRTKYENCESPRDVCIGLNSVAYEILEQTDSKGKEINIQEALETLQRSHTSGLVPISYTMKDDENPGFICSCCPCCCHALGTLVRSGSHEKFLTSRYIANTDDKMCVSCGVCVERCAFEARSIETGLLEFNPSKCFGCGLCVSTCTEHAINLISRKG
jgi:ferredoxin